jgi:hypothetical protein
MERSKAVLVGNLVVMVAIVASVVSILDSESTVEGRAPNVKRDWQNVLQRMDALSDVIFKRSYKYSRPHFYALVELLRPRLPHRPHAIPVAVRLAVTLRGVLL